MLAGAAAAQFQIVDTHLHLHPCVTDEVAVFLVVDLCTIVLFYFIFLRAFKIVESSPNIVSESTINLFFFFLSIFPHGTTSSALATRHTPSSQPHPLAVLSNDVPDPNSRDLTQPSRGIAN